VGRWNDLRRQVESFYVGDARYTESDGEVGVRAEGAPYSFDELPDDIYEGAE
jgi:hypothetical protein